MSRIQISPYAPSAAIISVALLAAGFTMQESLPFGSVTVSKTYTAPDFGTIESLGACSITPDTVTCWDASGAADPSLTEKVKAYYIVDSNAEVRYRFGRKNRLLVFKRPSNFRSGSYMSAFHSGNGGYLNNGGQIGANGRGNEPYIEWYNFDADPSEATATIEADINIGLGSGTVPLKEGAEGKVGPLTIHVNSIRPAADRTSWNDVRSKQKSWAVSVTVSGYQGPTMPSLGGRVLDANGISILRVNANGIPLPESSNRGVVSGYQPPAGFDAALQGGMGNSGSTVSLALSVNPSKASALSLTATGIRKVKITDIPLDPK